jgi:hypothetical protein
MSATDYIRQKSEANLHSNWTTTPVAFDGIEFDSTAQDRWIRHTLLTGDSFQNALPSCVRHTGIVSIEVFTEQNAGTKPAYDLADAANALYQLKNIGGIHFRQGSVNRVGHVDDFYKLTVFIPYQYDEVIT